MHSLIGVSQSTCWVVFQPPVLQGGVFTEEGVKRNMTLQRHDKRSLGGMTPNAGDYDRDGFVDIYVTEWMLNSIGEVSGSVNDQKYLALLKIDTTLSCELSKLQHFLLVSEYNSVLCPVVHSEYTSWLKDNTSCRVLRPALAGAVLSLTLTICLLSIVDLNWGENLIVISYIFAVMFILLISCFALPFVCCENHPINLQILKICN